MVDLTIELANFIAETKYSNLPSNVVEEAKRHIADLIAIGLSGSKTKVGKDIVNFVDKNYHGDDSILWGQDKKSSLFGSILANSTMVFHLDLDDVHSTSHTHPGVSTIPAVFSVAEKYNICGKDIINAIVVGYDVGIRVGNVVSPSIYVDKPFMAPGILSAICAGAGLAKLRNFSKAECAKILGSTAFLAPIAIFEAYAKGTSIKELIMGWGSMAGAMSMELLPYNFFGPNSALEGKLGFVKTVADRYNLERGIKNIGSVFEINNTGFKPYACCRQHHSAIDAALSLKEKYDFSIDDIDKIIDRTFTVASRGNEKNPVTIGGAKYSAPYIIAVALIEGKVWRDQFLMDKIKDKKIKSLENKVEVRVDKELDSLYDEKWPSIIEIYLKDGSHFEYRKDLPKGEPEFPISNQELKEKFIDLATDTIPEKDAIELWEIIFNLEKENDLSRLNKYLTNL